MRKILFLIVFLFAFITNKLIAQYPLFQEEISLEVQGFTEQTEVIYTLEAIGTVWANSSITTQYLIANELVSGNWSGTGKGWRIFWEEAPFEPFAHGFYRLKTNYNVNQVYIDFRDCKFANLSYSPNYETDFNLKYDEDGDNFYYKDNSDMEYTLIPDFGIVRIWEIKNGDPVTSCFNSYWSKCLVVIPSPNNNPRLVWGPYPNSIPINYKIYRHISQVPNPIHPTYQLVSTVSSSTFDFIDYEIMLDKSGSYVFYYVTAMLNEWNSSASNIVMTRGGLYKENTKNENVLAENHLYENYPNPFNPSTSIQYLIGGPVNGTSLQFVTLKVYDVLGIEVATLVNEEKPVGTYEIQFDGSQLSSGIYFYKLQTGLVVEVKKMILVR